MENFFLFMTPKKKGAATSIKDFILFLKILNPNSLRFEGKKVQIAIFRLQTLAYHQYIARVSKKFCFSLCCVAKSG